MSDPTDSTSHHRAQTRNRATFLMLAGAVSWVLGYQMLAPARRVWVNLGTGDHEPPFVDRMHLHPEAWALLLMGALCMMSAGVLLHRKALFRR